MKRSSILALCLVMVVGGGLALAGEALGAGPKRGGTLTVVHSVDISNFDVQAAPGYEVGVDQYEYPQFASDPGQRPETGA